MGRDARARGLPDTPTPRTSRPGRRGTPLVSCLRRTLTVGARQDLVGRLDPNEGSAPVVPGVQKALDGLSEGGHALEHASVKSASVQEGEPDLDLIHPTGAGGCEVQVDSLVTLEPAGDLGVLVCVVVVDDQIQCLPCVGSWPEDAGRRGTRRAHGAGRSRPRPGRWRCRVPRTGWWCRAGRSHECAVRPGRTARSIEVGANGVEGFLAELQADLKARTFRPLPARQRLIPKASGKVRALGLPAVRDRVVQASLKLVLEPILEADFYPVSYGFRPNRRAQDAIEEIRTYARSGYEWVFEGDIAACFDEIDHGALMGRLRRPVGDKRVLALIKAFLKAGLLTETGVDRETNTGTPQGGILSPLLANLALSVLDEHFVGRWQRDNATTYDRVCRRFRGPGERHSGPSRGTGQRGAAQPSTLPGCNWRSTRRGS
jgi:hypothetical protein